MIQPLSFLFCREIAKHVHISISPPHPGGVICNLNAFLAYQSLVSVSWIPWFEGYAVTHFICLFVLFAFATVSPGICNFHKVTHTNITVVQNSQVYNFMFSMEHKDFFSSKFIGLFFCNCWHFYDAAFFRLSCFFFLNCSLQVRLCGPSCRLFFLQLCSVSSFYVLVLSNCSSASAMPLTLV